MVKKHNIRGSAKGSDEEIVNDNATFIEIDANSSHRG